MKKFINRNAPVFIIGGITLAIFLIIITLSQKDTQPPTKLIEADEKDLIAPHTYVRGSLNPKVTIVEFSDYGCPACKQWHPVLESVMGQFPNDISWGYRHFPLPQHKNADKAAVAAQAAGEQNKFWEYSAKLFENQGSFNDDQLISYAEQLGMDTKKFEDDYKNGGFESLVKDDMLYGNQIGIQATPTIFVNGKQIKVENFEEFVKLISDEIENNKQSGSEETTNTPTSIFPNTGGSTSGGSSNAAHQALNQKIDSTWGTVTINYRESGFVPKSTQLFSGQLVTWINATDKEIAIEQLIDKFEEFKEPVKIAPGGKFEFRTYDSKIWTYQEATTKDFGSIFIKPRPEGF